MPNLIFEGTLTLGDARWLVRFAVELDEPDDDPGNGDLARQRVEMTQPPLPGLIVEQTSFLEEGD